MKKIVLAALFAASVTGLALPSQAQTAAPACKGSCSDMLVRCDAAKGGRGCTTAFKRCLRNGTYVRPVSKRTFTNLCKQ